MQSTPYLFHISLHKVSNNIYSWRNTRRYIYMNSLDFFFVHRYIDSTKWKKNYVFNSPQIQIHPSIHQSIKIFFFFFISFQDFYFWDFYSSINKNLFAHRRENKNVSGAIFHKCNKSFFFMHMLGGWYGYRWRFEDDQRIHSLVSIDYENHLAIFPGMMQPIWFFLPSS